jgi:hypothetical protein
MRLIREVLRVRKEQGSNTHFIWVKAHSKNQDDLSKGNELADKLAKRARKEPGDNTWRISLLNGELPFMLARECGEKLKVIHGHVRRTIRKTLDERMMEVWSSVKKVRGRAIQSMKPHFQGIADPFKQVVRENVRKLSIRQKGAFLVVMSRSIRDTWDAQIQGSPYLAGTPITDMICKRCTWPVPVTTGHVISCPGFPFKGVEIQEHLAEHFGIKKTYKSCRSLLLRHLDILLRKREVQGTKSRELSNIPKGRRILMLASILDGMGKCVFESCDLKGDNSKTGILAFKRKEITLEDISDKIIRTVKKCQNIQSDVTLLKLTSWMANVFGLHVEITSSPLTYNPDLSCWFSFEDQWQEDWKIKHYLNLLDEFEGTTGLLTLTQDIEPFRRIWAKLKTIQGIVPTRWLGLVPDTEASQEAIKEFVETESKTVECQVIAEAELEYLDGGKAYAHPKGLSRRLLVVLMQTKGMLITHPVNYQQFCDEWKKRVPKGKMVWKQKSTKASSQEIRMHDRMGYHPLREEIYPFMFLRPLAQDYIQSLRKVKGGLNEFKDADDVKFDKTSFVVDSAIVFSGIHVMPNEMDEPEWLNLYRSGENRYITSVVLEQTAEVLSRYGFKRQLQESKQGVFEYLFSEGWLSESESDKEDFL